MLQESNTENKETFNLYHTLSLLTDRQNASTSEMPQKIIMVFLQQGHGKA
jgi:hypothetical protein